MKTLSTTQHNNEAITNFFLTQGEQTRPVYSKLLSEMTALVMKDEMDNPRRTSEELDDILFDLNQLNSLVVSLKDPIREAAEESVFIHPGVMYHQRPLPVFNF
jgi:hypothetical protein